LAKQIVGEWDDIIILLTGSPEEREEVRELCKQIGHVRVFDLRAKLHSAS
jgi:hypothetical protein